jgi:hypothetical protein
MQVVGGLNVSGEFLDTHLANKGLEVRLSPIVWSNTLKKKKIFVVLNVEISKLNF